MHYKFELMDETLFLTVNIIDRFLERQLVIRKKLQLVGVTALLLACKYEEVIVPVVEDLILICDKAYTKDEILDMVIFGFQDNSLSNSDVPFFPSIGNYGVCLPIGDTDGEHFTIQHVCSNPIYVHEEIPKGSSVRQKA